MDYVSSKKQRFSELTPGKNGRLQTEWQLTEAKFDEPVRLTMPPNNALPIVFVPGIMGSNLCDLAGAPVWLLNSIKDIPVGLAWSWSRKGPGARKQVLHPKRTKVFQSGAVPDRKSKGGYASKHYLECGWGEVSEASYHKFLLWLEDKLNGERNPINWEDFSNPSAPAPEKIIEQLNKKLPSGLIMKMAGLPYIAEKGYACEPVTSDELLKRSKFFYPIYAFGYNWLDSNIEAAKGLKSRTERIISSNNVGAIKCTQVILVAHSMGGLVARACSQMPGMPEKIVGIVHGVMPATGAAVAYRRCKVGMTDEDFGAGLVIGSDGKVVTAVFAQSPGALQLLPSESYGTRWLEILDPGGKLLKALPVSDPYAEIYLERNKWWGLIREDWLNLKDGEPIDWDVYVTNVSKAKEFHKLIAKKFHRNTYVFYGGGEKIGSFARIQWKIQKGMPTKTGGQMPAFDDILALSYSDFRTSGSNSLYLGGEPVNQTITKGDTSVVISNETSILEIHCGSYNSSGDGTVPSISGQDPRTSGGGKLLQQFELSGVQHEPAFRDSLVAKTVAYYSITKLAAKADLP